VNQIITSGPYAPNDKNKWILNCCLNQLRHTEYLLLNFMGRINDHRKNIRFVAIFRRLDRYGKLGRCFWNSTYSQLELKDP